MKEIHVELLISPACHNCAAVKELWEEIKGQWPNVIYSEVNILDPEGQEMVQKYQIFSSPGLIINGALFGTGNINRDLFINTLRELSE